MITVSAYLSPLPESTNECVVYLWVEHVEVSNVSWQPFSPPARHTRVLQGAVAIVVHTSLPPLAVRIRGPVVSWTSRKHGMSEETVVMAVHSPLAQHTRGSEVSQT